MTDSVRQLRREVKRLSYELGAAVSQVPHLRLLVEGARDGLALVSADGCVLECNTAFMQLTSSSLGGVMGASLGSLVSLSGVDFEPDRPLEEVVRPGVFHLGTTRLDKSVEVVFSENQTATGEVVLVVSMRAYSESTQQARQLHRARQRAKELSRRLDAQRLFGELFESSPDALLLVDASLTLVQLNPLAQELWPALSRTLPLDEAVPALVRPLRDFLATESGGDDALEWTEGSPDAHRTLQAQLASVRVADGDCVLVAVRDVSARRDAERALESALQKTSQSLEEREVLLREIHHRVKNNLQVICSLLSLQEQGLESAAARGSLRQSRLRVQAMSDLHEKLYTSANVGRIDFMEYARDLCRTNQWVLGLSGSFSVVGESVALDLHRAVPLGLILNELLTNALKYGARPADDGRPSRSVVHVRVSQTADALCLVVEDEGPGFAEDFEHQRSSSLGYKLIQSLVRQLGGTLELESVPGARVTVRCPREA